jgi:glucokinase
MNREKRICHIPVLSFLGECSFGHYLKEYFNKPVYMGNDANAAALAESLFGSTKGVENSVQVTIGTGVGSGIIIDHKIYRRSHFAVPKSDI